MFADRIPCQCWRIYVLYHSMYVHHGASRGRIRVGSDDGPAYADLPLSCGMLRRRRIGHEPVAQDMEIWDFQRHDHQARSRYRDHRSLQPAIPHTYRLFQMHGTTRPSILVRLEASTFSRRQRAGWVAVERVLYRSSGHEGALSELRPLGKANDLAYTLQDVTQVAEPLTAYQSHDKGSQATSRDGVYLRTWLTMISMPCFRQYLPAINLSCCVTRYAGKPHSIYGVAIGG